MIAKSRRGTVQLTGICDNCGYPIRCTPWGNGSHSTWEHFDYSMRCDGSFAEIPLLQIESDLM